MTDFFAANPHVHGRRREHGRGPTSRAHLLQPGELRMLTRGMNVLFDEEEYLPEAVARIAARRRS